MATTTKKGSKNKRAKRRVPVVKASVAEQAQTYAELRQQLAESLQRESATAIENVRLFKELQERNRRPHRGAGAADSDERDFACDRQLTTRSTTSAGCYH